MTGGWPSEGGVVHVLSVWRPASWAANRPGRVIRLGRDSPRSPADAFMLDLARARADLILTSGSILRCEPGLRHDAPARGEAAEGLASWRRDVLGRTAPARLVVLTRGRDLDPSHPSLRSGACVMTGPEGERALRASAQRAGIEICVLEPAGPREAVAALCRQPDATAVTVEFGANAARPLYQSQGRGQGPEPGRVLVDELWLSTYLEDGLGEDARGAEFLAPERIHEIFGAPVSHTIRDEPSGRWSFERYRRCEVDRAGRAADVLQRPLSESSSGATSDSTEPV